MKNYLIAATVFVVLAVVGYYATGLNKLAAAADAKLAAPVAQNAEEWLASQGVK